MNNKAITLSLIMAVAAIFFVQSYVQSIEDEARKKYGTEIVVLKARKDIKEMDTLNDTHFDLQSIPARFKEPAAISFEGKAGSEKDLVRKLKPLVGAVALVPIKKGEQITYNKITEAGLRTGLAPQVSPGRRAITIAVNETTSVGKLVKPGDRVDVVAVLDGGSKENRIAKTLLQDVVVLAVGRNVSNNIPRTVDMDPMTNKERVHNLNEEATFASVTLEVEPLAAQSIALVSASGESVMSLVLRNNDDTERVQLSGTMMPDVMGPDASRMAQRNVAGKK